MKMIKSNYFLFFLLFLIFVIISSITTSLAWLSIEGSKDVTAKPGTFIVSTTLSKNVNDTKEEIEPINGVYKLNGLSSENNENAKTILGNEYLTQYQRPLIDSISLNISLDAEIPGYMRVKLQDEWIVTRKYINFDRESTEIIFKDQSTHQLYKLAPGWVYDNDTNFFYYYNLIEKSDGPIDIPFIVSGDPYAPKTSSYYVETCEVNISVSVQVVQANRFEALWGIASIPGATM